MHLTIIYHQQRKRNVILTKPLISCPKLVDHYSIDHNEAMRQMLIQQHNEEYKRALYEEFGDKIAKMGFITDPEYGILVTLTGTATPLPDRILYRSADVLSEREIVTQAYKAMKIDVLTLTQAEVDKAMELIESPTRFIVRFEVNPTAINLRPH